MSDNKKDTLVVVASRAINMEFPAEGSRITNCADCNAQVYIAPSTDRMLATKGNMEHEFICNECLLERGARDDESFTFMNSKPTKDQLEEMKRMGIEWDAQGQAVFDLLKRLLEKKRK